MVLGLYNISYSQKSYGGRPVTRLYEQKKAIVPVVQLPKFDIQQYKSENQNNFKSQAFAKAFEVNINPGNSGVWDTYNDKKVWRVGVNSAGAYSLVFIFEPFYLPRGAELYIYNSDYSKVLGAYTFKNNKKSKVFPVEPLPGDIAYIELILPNNGLKDYQLNLMLVSHDYLDILSKLNENNLSNFIGDDECHTDVNCDLGDGWENLNDAVFYFIYYHHIEGVHKYCNGTLINNSRLNKHPYLLTARHCIWDDEVAASVVSFFQYETMFCDGPVINDSRTISSVNLISAINKLDFSLNEFDSLPSILYKPYFAGWNRINQTHTDVVCLHQPVYNGTIQMKKIAMDYDEVDIRTFSAEFDANSHYRVRRWDEGSTLAGSSGAPLFDNNKKIVGSLTGGQANCNDPVNDYFTMFAVAWDKYSEPNEQLKYWLDPDNTGIVTLDGMDPYKEYKESCDTIMSITGSKELMNYNSSNSFYTGHNTDGITEFAQYFSNEEKISEITGVYFNIARANSGIPGAFITIKLWSSENITPAELISQKDYNLADLYEGEYNLLDFDTIAKVKGSYFIGYEIYYNRIRTDTFALYHSNVKTDETENYYVYDNEWVRSDIYYSNQNIGALDIIAVRCNTITDIDPEPTEPFDFKYGPNPVANYINITFGEKYTENNKFYLYDVTGKLLSISIQPLSENSYSIDLTDYKSGIYFLKIESSARIVIKKIIVIK